MKKTFDSAFVSEILQEKHRYTKFGKFIRRVFSFINKHNPHLKLDVKFKGMMGVEKGVNIYHLLSQVLVQKIPGDVVELGCYAGLTSVVMQKTLDQHEAAKQLHLYDSFEGLPELSAKDGKISDKAGSMSASMKQVIGNFKRFRVKLPKLHRGWFRDTLPNQLPEKICFAHLDGDLYSSIKESLTYVYPRLSKGAVVVIDDYCDNSVIDVKDVFPGVKKACDEFFRDKEEKVSVLSAGDFPQGYFRKE
ncbi:class I SAM-dependent methyltransferase [Candidatus Woesearchaeota archaeon]|nr:class I SAM-dependent methyltransferase [Candidatus Woesearchaeota archaeon]